MMQYRLRFAGSDRRVNTYALLVVTGGATACASAPANQRVPPDASAGDALVHSYDAVAPSDQLGSLVQPERTPEQLSPVRGTM